MSEESLFHEALAQPPAERGAFLDAACAGQSELRAAVEALLAAHDASGNLLDRRPSPAATGQYVPQPGDEQPPPVPQPKTADFQPASGPGAVIAGRYTLVEKIGEGGMGEVWVAKQTEPVKRKVALKLIKAGMDSKAVLARFEAERQALALMDHPCIAKVLDGGLTPSGHPYFVMELAGRHREAIPLLEEAVRASKTYPNPTLLGMGSHLIDAYMKAGESAKLGSFLLEQLTNARQSLPKESPQLALLLAQLGLALLEQKKWAEAEPLLREALAIREQRNPDDWRTFNTRSLLGGALAGQKKYADAEPLLLTGYEGMKARAKSILPQAATRIPEALDRLIELYTATNKPDEVTKYKELRAKYPPPTNLAPQSPEKQ